MPAIVVENLVKTFRVAERRRGLAGALAGVLRRRHREVRALDGVSFSLEPGELVGYIGPNGAGKSTTVKVLSGILVPDAGRCEVLGRVPWTDRVEHVRKVGVVFGQRTQLWWDLPVAESFDLLRAIYRVPASRHRVVRDDLVERLGLGPLLDVPVRQLSLGQRMKCDLAASLLHEPQVLFLDEPTIGLDAPAKLGVRDFVRTLHRERGATGILTTHDLDDIEALCPRVLVVHRGRVHSDGPLETLRERVGARRRLVVDLERTGEQVTDPDAEVVRTEGHRVELRFDPRRVPAAALIARVAGRHAVRDLFVEDEPIDEIVARLYSSCEGEEGA